MFFSRTTPLSVAPVHVQGLRLSLNTPVVATEELPIGPARAAILVHDDPQLGPTVTIGIRSLRADRVALYGMDTEPGDGTDLEVAVDAALTFAESMGFLFDEDEVAGGGAQAKSRSLGLWRDLLGDELGEPARALAPVRQEEPESELLLEDLAEEATEFVLPPAEAPGEPDPEIGDFVEDQDREVLGAQPSEAPEDEPGDELPDVSDAEVAAEVSKAAAGRAKRPAAVSLTKFRGRSAARAARAPARPEAPARAAKPSAAKAGADAQNAQKGGATALGRMRLVRRARDGLRKRHPILRLFGAF